MRFHQVNDHGTFSIILDEQVLTSNTLSGRSGCDGQNRKYCEKLGGLHYFVGGIGEGTHNMTIVNDGNPETPYLGELDSFRTKFAGQSA